MSFNSRINRRTIQAAWDGLAWVLAVPLALLLRYDFSPPATTVPWAVLAGLGAASIQFGIGYAFHLYRGRYIVGSFDEVLGVVVTAAAVGASGSVAVLLLPATEFPRSSFIIATGIAIAIMLGARFAWRGARQQSALRRSGARTLIYGAGDAGSQIVNLMLADPSGQFQPVGFIDDDQAKTHLRRAGVRVIGSRNDIERLARELDVEILLVAIAGITAPELLDIDHRCTPLGIRMQVIPTASEIIEGAVRLGDISDVTEEDLMGRRPVHTNEGQITDFIRGKRVLVTGAGGSIGSELARQLSRYEPARLTLLDRDESGLHAVQLTLDGTGTLTNEDLVLADVRDESKMEEIFGEVRPEIVFHAAALKHLPVLERYPDEALKTNVLGTRNTLRAACSAQVSVFVNISTDKAADPISVLGYSKLITERMTAGVTACGESKFVSVRFGNVLGSRGSVIETFRYQISKGGPVTVTDERVTRYFMTVSEAVHLVLQAAVLGSHGETLILDMGKPVSIADIARHMIKRSGREIEIRYTGLRPGEKSDEVLTGRSEIAERRLHPRVSHTSVSPLRLPETLATDNARQTLEEMALTLDSSSERGLGQCV